MCWFHLHSKLMPYLNISTNANVLFVILTWWFLQARYDRKMIRRHSYCKRKDIFISLPCTLSKTMQRHKPWNKNKDELLASKTFETFVFNDGTAFFFFAIRHVPNQYFKTFTQLTRIYSFSSFSCSSTREALLYKFCNI